jgi:hypothetical protein
VKWIIFRHIVFSVSIPCCAYYALQGSRFNIWVLIVYSLLLWISIVIDDHDNWLDKKYPDA